MGPGPSPSRLLLRGGRCSELDPETMCAQFNKQNPIATATPFDLKEEGENDTSDIVIAIQSRNRNRMTQTHCNTMTVAILKTMQDLTTT